MDCSQAQELVRQVMATLLFGTSARTIFARTILSEHDKDAFAHIGNPCPRNDPECAAMGYALKSVFQKQSSREHHCE